MDVTQVKLLNNHIEDIQSKRTKAQAQKEVLLNRLNEDIQKYEEAYGVSLQGKSLKETIALISAEAKKVSSSIKEEYELKTAVVDAIESGDIAKANELLGIEVVEEVEEYEEPTENEEEIRVAMKPMGVDFDSNDSDDVVVEEAEPTETTDFDEDDFGGFEDTAVADDDDFGLDDVGVVEEEEDDYDFSISDDDMPDMSEMGSSVDDTIEDLESGSDDMFADFDDDFGFGGILQGSKFED